METKNSLSSCSIFIMVVARVLFATESNPSQITKPEIDPYIAKQVKNTIFKSARDLQKCWLPYLAAHPKTERVKIEIDWQIKQDGKVLSPEVVRSEAPNKLFENCLKKKITALHFPPHDVTVPKYIAHKFTFKKETATK